MSRGGSCKGTHSQWNSLDVLISMVYKMWYIGVIEME